MDDNSERPRLMSQSADEESDTKACVTKPKSAIAHYVRGARVTPFTRQLPTHNTTFSSHA